MADSKQGGDAAWDLVFAKRYAEALELFQQRRAEDDGELPLRAHAQMLLLLGRPAEAIPEFSQVIDATEPKFRNHSDFFFLGTCHWYLSQPTEAITAWLQGLTAPYTDAAGGVECPAILLYAATRLRDDRLEAEALRLLRGHWRKHLRRVRRGAAKTARQAHEDFVHPGLYSWPGALVPFLLGEIDENALDAAATRFEALRSRWQCQADFIAGLRAKREGNEAAFRERMARSAAAQYGELETGFYLARWEVANDFPEEVVPG